VANDNTSIVKQSKNKEPVAGFNVHPENINRKGRPPKEHSITDTIKQFMDDKPEIKEAISKKILQLVLDGDVQTIKTLWGYLDGMPTQKHDVGDELKQIMIEWKHGKDNNY